MWNKEKNIVRTKDAVDGSWVYRHAPLPVRPYLKLARVDRPVGTWLLLWPCLWSLLLASDGVDFDLALIALLFAIGALVMRGAGCTYNDIVDRDFDGQVDRTKSRPIPAGEVSVPGAWLFIAFQCLIGLTILLQFNKFAILVGFGSLFLVAVYPFMKRITYWPQAWLGLTFNWGALLGWAAIRGELSLTPILLYFGGLFWTLGYDTIYAHQDKEDDALIGVKSTALALGSHTKHAVAVFYAFFVISLIAIGMLEMAGIIYYTGVAVAAGQLTHQILRVRIDEPDSCLNIFRANIGFGWILFITLIIDKWY